ncbi:protein rogdi homolog isoform X1 [Asterias rubens]|uniref:protein rogdi homolog isoform X1 n=1 Tax=Asterias rubens TaxID=7604 RepID=UPI0014559AFA|nr:protein rogdi homolog isoform X1 [Asterias rubens]
MAEDSDGEERLSLEDEFHWLLKEEVHPILLQLQQLLKENTRRFNIPISVGLSKLIKPETFVLSCSNGADYAKGVVTLVADSICRADLSLRMHRNANQVAKTSIREDIPWKLQQVQDAGNHLYSALNAVSRIDVDYEFQTGTEVTKLMDEVMNQLKKGRHQLLNPIHPSLHDLYFSKCSKSLNPPLPQEILIDFYVQGNKLNMCTYFLHLAHSPKTPSKHSAPPTDKNLNVLELGPMKYELTGQYTVHCAVPWLGEALTLFTVALQTCQELKNKIEVFSTYRINEANP